MKNLLTAIACCLAVASFGQGTTIHEYPWNPDWNNDNFVGSSDLTGFLSAFGSEFGNPPEPCTYDGTDFEELIFGISAGDIILDSMYVEVELEQIAEYYALGCPDLLIDTILFVNSAMLTSNNWVCNSGETHYIAKSGNDDYGNVFAFQFGSYSNGVYHIRLGMSSIDVLGFNADGFFGSSDCATSESSSVPLPEQWTYDSLGLHVLGAGWGSHSWPYYANYLHILPYWHYAE